MTTANDSLKEFIAGTAGGFAGKLIDYPLDTVKVLLQTQPSTSVAAAAAAAEGPPGGVVVYRGAWHCLRYTYEAKGVVNGLYKGLASPLLGSMAENALLFWAYNHAKRALLLLGEDSSGDETQKPLTLFQLSLAGAGAGAVVPFVLTPVELVKCRLQVQNSTAAGVFRSYKGPIDVIVQTIKTEGVVRGLYRGHASTLLREIPGNFVWFGLYEGVCQAMTPPGGTKADLGPSVHLMGGGKYYIIQYNTHFRIECTI
jgi:hypothetical protein